MVGLLGRDDIDAYSFRTMARGWAPSVVPHPWRKKSIDSFTEPQASLSPIHNP